jgi:adenosine deaminase CECR1
MVGSTTMNLHGWRQLAEWSLQYSCLGPDDLRMAQTIFKRKWEAFCERVVEKYAEHADGLDIEVPPV